MKYIIILALQIFSSKPVEVKANQQCDPTSNNVEFHISTKIVCIPPDVIFKGGFEK